MADMGAVLTAVKPLDRGGLSLGGRAGGEVEMAFELPYVIADTEIEGKADIQVGGAISFLFSVDGGKTWLLGGEVKKNGPFGPISIGMPNTYEFPAGSTTGRYGYALKMIFRCNYRRKATVLQHLKITNTTMLNFYSRPWLEVGENHVTVTAKDNDALAKSPLEITWRWLEDWKTQKSFVHRIRKSGATAVIEVGGSRRPKMRSVTIACPPRPSRP
jgi:hypothetical protein